MTAKDRLDELRAEIKESILSADASPQSVAASFGVSEAKAKLMLQSRRLVPREGS